MKKIYIHSLIATFLTAVLLFINVVSVSAYDKNEVINLVNSQRINEHLPPFKTDKKLDLVAEKKVNDMMQKQYWSHLSPSGEMVWDLMDQLSYKYMAAGENLAKGFTDDKSMVDAWMNSPLHRANILATQFDKVGVAQKKGQFEGKETEVVVLLFSKQ